MLSVYANTIPTPGVEKGGQAEGERERK